MKGYIRKIINISPVDGPGNRMVVFLQGCNFDCKYCHNPETIEIANKDMNGVSLMAVREVVDKVLFYKDFLAGVTISGGECTVQYDFLIELAKELSFLGISVYIDTNGNFGKSKREELCRYSDKFMLDVKSFDLNEHVELTGVSNNNVIENLKELLSVGKIYEVRTVIVPDIIDNERNVKEISKIIASYDKSVRYKLITFRNHGVRDILKNTPSPEYEYMIKLKGIAEKEGLKNIILV